MGLSKLAGREYVRCHGSENSKEFYGDLFVKTSINSILLYHFEINVNVKAISLSSPLLL